MKKNIKQKNGKNISKLAYLKSCIKYIMGVSLFFIYRINYTFVAS